MIELITKYFSDFTEEQLAKFQGLKNVYEEWNTKINVISRKDMDDFYLHHVLHSLSIPTQFGFADNETVMDLGCGGGFPGVPLAIMFPQTKFHLVDSINKKLTVVKEVCKALDIHNVETFHSRAEQMPKTHYDTIVSRAVAPLKDLWMWSKPLLKRNSHSDHNGLICLKGGDLSEEIFQSGCKPHVWEIEQMFEEDYFMSKYLLFVKR